jgi:hypothetical protein
VFEELLVKWLDVVSQSGHFSDVRVYLRMEASANKEKKKSMPALYRFVNRELEQSGQRYTTEPTSPTKASFTFNPWQLVYRVASTSKESLLSSLRWLRTLAVAGIEIPTQAYTQFSTLIIKYETSLGDSIEFFKAIFSSTWLRSMGQGGLQTVLATFHSHFAAEIIEPLSAGQSADDV